MVNPSDGADASGNKTIEVLTVYLRSEQVSFYKRDTDQDDL